MPWLSKNEKRYRLLLTIVIGVAVGLLLILGIRVVLFYVPDVMHAILSWLMHLFLRPIALTAPVFTPSSPVLPTSTLLSATYAELFSGVGEDDVVDTSVYEDNVATTISLLPVFSVSPTTATFAPVPTMPADVPASENLSGATVTASADGKVYTAHIPAFPNLVVTSSYAGIVRFGYDPSTGRTLIIYAAYESRVLEVGSTGAVIADYSSRFGSRAFAGYAFGSRGVDPVIFSQDGAWWIFSGAGSIKPKLLKIQNGAVIDYAGTAFPDVATMLVAAPGPAPHEIYVKDSAGSYILTDKGFTQTPAQWVSSKLNQWNGNVARGEILSVEDSAGAGGVSASIPAPRYFLSNDGGATWVSVAPGEQITFSTSGGDFRFKAALSPAGVGASGASSADLYSTPWVHIVRLEYWMARNVP